MRYRTSDRELTRVRRLSLGVIRHCRQRQKGVEVPLHALTYGLCVSSQLRLHPLKTPLLQVDVESLEAIERWDRHEEVASGVSDHTLNLPLVVALARTSEPVLEQVVGLKLSEHACAPASTVSQDPRNRKTGVVRRGGCSEGLLPVTRTPTRVRHRTPRWSPQGMP